MKKTSALQLKPWGKGIDGGETARLSLRFSDQIDAKFTTNFRKTDFALEKAITTFMTGVNLQTCEMPDSNKDERQARKKARQQEEKAIFTDSNPLFEHFIDCLNDIFGEREIQTFLEPLAKVSLTQEATDKLASLDKDHQGMEAEFFTKDTKRLLYSTFSRYLLAYRNDPNTPISDIFKSTSVKLYKSSIDHDKIHHVSNSELAESGIFFNAAAQPDGKPVKHNLDIRVFNIRQLKTALNAVASGKSTAQQETLFETFKEWTNCDTLEAYKNHPVGQHSSNIGKFKKDGQSFYYINGNITNINKLAIQRAAFTIDIIETESGIQINPDDSVSIDGFSSHRIKAALFKHSAMNTNPNNQNRKTKTLEQLANAGIYLSTNNNFFSTELHKLTDTQFESLTGYNNKAEYLEANKNQQIVINKIGGPKYNIRKELIRLHLSDEVIQSCPKSNDNCKEEETRQTILKELFERTEESPRVKHYQFDKPKVQAFQELQQEQKQEALEQLKTTMEEAEFNALSDEEKYSRLDKSGIVGKFPMIKIGMQYQERAISMDSQNLVKGCDDESGTTALPNGEKIYLVGSVDYNEETNELAYTPRNAINPRFMDVLLGMRRWTESAKKAVADSAAAPVGAAAN